MSNHSSANETTYLRYLQSYGADIHKWPDVDLAEAARWLANADARQVEDAAQIDALLETAFNQIKTPSALHAHILAAVTPKPEKTADMGWMLAFRPTLRPIASLIAATFIGVALGTYMPDFVLNDSIASQEDYVLYENFIEWDGDSDNG